MAWDGTDPSADSLANATRAVVPPARALVAKPAVAGQPPGAAGALTRRPPADVRLPCMVYAAVGALVNPGAEVVELAMADARRAPGVVNVLTYAGGTVEGSLACAGGVAVITRGYWLARQALARLVGQFGPALRPVALDGGLDPECLSRASPSNLTATGAACTVQWYNGQLRIWMAAADPARVVAAAARIAGCPAAAVDLRLLGDGNAVHGLAALLPAIALARAVQSAPVQLIVAYDLGLHCQPPIDAARVPREISAYPEGIARAA